jgi:hypothetical protein
MDKTRKELTTENTEKGKKKYKTGKQENRKTGRKTENKKAQE